MSASPHQQVDPDTAVTCAVVSAVLTTRQSASAGRHDGSLTEDQSRAILATIPLTIPLALGAPGADLNEQVSALLASATTSPDAPLETPEALRALGEIRRACEANTTPIIVMADGG
jgi:hypothetical protein